MAIGVWQMVIILALVLIVFGGRRLPELGRGLGLSQTNFRSVLKSEEKTEVSSSQSQSGPLKES